MSIYLKAVKFLDLLLEKAVVFDVWFGCTVVWVCYILQNVFIDKNRVLIHKTLIMVEKIIAIVIALSFLQYFVIKVLHHFGIL